LMMIDLCGSLPGYIVKKATSVQGELVLSVRKFIQRREAGKPRLYLPMVNLPNGPLNIQPYDKSAVAKSARPVTTAQGAKKRLPVAVGVAKPTASTPAQDAPHSETRPGGGVWAHKAPLQHPIQLAKKPALGMHHYAMLLLLPAVYYGVQMVPSLAATGPIWFVLATAVFVLRYWLSG
jgi:hypothetical protein